MAGEVWNARQVSKRRDWGDGSSRHAGMERKVRRKRGAGKHGRTPARVTCRTAEGLLLSNIFMVITLDWC